MPVEQRLTAEPAANRFGLRTCELGKSPLERTGRQPDADDAAGLDDVETEPLCLA